MNEKCPGCAKTMKWQLGNDYYCIEGERGSVETTTSDTGDISDTHFCTCGRMIAIAVDNEHGAEVFVNSENYNEVEEFIDNLCELEPKLEEQGFDEFNGYFVHYDKFIESIGKAWGGDNPGYNNDPLELIGTLIDDRNTLRAALKLIVKQVLDMQHMMRGRFNIDDIAFESNVAHFMDTVPIDAESVIRESEWYLKKRGCP